MRRRGWRGGAAAVCVLAGVALLLGGCFGGGSSDNTNTTRTTRTTVASSIGGSSTSTSIGAVTGTTIDAALSTFRSKDPFIQQAQTPTTTATGAGGTTATTTQASTTTGKITVTTIAGGGGGGGGGATTSTTAGSGGTSSTTSTTAPHLHTMKILSVAQVAGAPAVTFQVDGSVYKDRHVGDVVSSNWGQIKVLEVNLSSKVVTLLQGSETLVLSVGQVIFQ